MAFVSPPEELVKSSKDCVKITRSEVLLPSNSPVRMVL